MENEEKIAEQEEPTLNDEEAFSQTREGNVVQKEKYVQVREVVFLAICAAAGLLTSSVMPLVSQVPVYGLIQIVVSLQTSFFLSLGLFKVRKSPALLFMAICYAIIQIFMAPVMFFMSLISAALLEVVALIVPSHWKNNIMRILGSVLFIPLQMPMLWFYYSVMAELPESYVGNQWWFILLMVLAVVALNALGTFLGNLVGRELDKAGVLDGSRKSHKKGK